jgi:hypothetical protein
MLTDSDKINGLPIRAEIRVPRERVEGAPVKWLSSVVVCQDTNPDGLPVGRFVVWSVYQDYGRASVHAENGIYDIVDYGHALELAYQRSRTRV